MLLYLTMNLKFKTKKLHCVFKYHTEFVFNKRGYLTVSYCES